MSSNLHVELKDLPSFRVASMSVQALTFQAGLQPLTITEQVQDIGSSLLSWAKSVGIDRERLHGIFGLSIIEGGWKATGESMSLSAKSLSQSFIQGLPMGQDILSISDLAASIGVEGFSKSSGITIRHTRPGLYAVARIKGPYSSLSLVAEELMTKWMPSNGFSYANEPLLNLYVNNPDTTPEEELLTDFCIPLAGLQQIPLGLFASFLAGAKVKSFVL